MFVTKGSAARGTAASVDAVLGATRLWARGPYVRRCRYPTDKATLCGRHEPLSLLEQERLNRWAYRR